MVRKIDLHLIPALFLLFIFNILDRSNIANARLGGLQEDLGLSDTQYQTAVALMVRVDTNSVFHSRLTRPTCPVRWISPWPSSEQHYPHPREAVALYPCRHFRVGWDLHLHGSNEELCWNPMRANLSRLC